jgi:hypothetical protein
MYQVWHSYPKSVADLDGAELQPDPPPSRLQFAINVSNTQNLRPKIPYIVLLFQERPYPFSKFLDPPLEIV